MTDYNGFDFTTIEAPSWLPVLNHPGPTRCFRGMVREKLDVGSIASQQSCPDLVVTLQQFLINSLSLANAVPSATNFLSLTHNVIKSTPAKLYNTYSVPVENFQDNSFTIHPIRCTGPHSWQNGPPRNDFVLIDKSEKGTYGALGRLGVARIEAFIELSNPVMDEIHQVAMITELVPENAGNLIDGSGMVRFVWQQPIESYVSDEISSHRKIIPITDIICLAHMVSFVCQKKIHGIVSEIPKLFLNSHIDLTIYNAVY